MKRLLGALLAGALVTAAAYHPLAQSKAAQTPAASSEWPTYGHDPGGMRFSPVTQITPANVSQLKVAWVYHMKPPVAAAPRPGRRGRRRRRDEEDADGGSGFAPSETTPLVIDGVMYISTPFGRVVALDPTTGKEVWVLPGPAGGPSTRGVEYWPGDAQTPPQIVFGTSDGKLYLARREDRQAQRGLRRQRHRRL